MNWFENNFSACTFEDVFQSLFLWQLFGACHFENGFMGAMMVLIVPTSWIWNSYNKSVFKIITGRPLRGPRLAARSLMKMIILWLTMNPKKFVFETYETQNSSQGFWWNTVFLCLQHFFGLNSFNLMSFRSISRHKVLETLVFYNFVFVSLGLYSPGFYDFLTFPNCTEAFQLFKLPFVQKQK